ncbi:dynein beta chain, ciliary-like, partial [Drosophila sechellia]|uniref:dynein beta chain, ciliary-like n=1 Tax=Drosophila sechellia TaxID=7238 RepID=UPI0013DDCDB9
DVVIEFLNNPNKKRIIFTINSGGQLYPSYSFPVRPRYKVAYFIRYLIPLHLTDENMLNSLLIGDLLPNPLANLSVLCDEVFFPLLNNTVNQVGWTNVIANDMKTESQEMRNGIAQMKGLVINRTIFPLPICMDEVMQAAPAIAMGDISVVNPLMKHSLEFMVVKWLDSVEDLVNIKAGERIYSKENFPLPEAIFSFWESRLENLESLAEQLGDRRIKTIGFVLEKIQSIFEHSYRRIVELVLESLAEARDITKCLSPLKKKMDKFETNDMDENRSDIRPLMLTVGLVWGHSRYFHTLNNMTLFFNLFQNSLIDCVNRTVEPDSIFQGDVDEAYKKLDINMQHLEYYKSIYNECRNSLKKFKIGTTFNSQDWTWHHYEIFGRLDKFLVRMEELKDLFNTVRDFQKLEKIVMGGLKGRQVTSALEKILEEYNSIYREWTNIQYNPIDPDAENSLFQRDRLSFKAKTDVMERMVSFQFEKGLEDTHDLLLAGSLLLRPIIKRHVEPLMHVIVDDFEDEIMC